MTRMYPPYVPLDLKSPGEIEIFRRLQDDPLTSGWTAFHSLDIAKHVRQISGEIDFVVVVPAKGILCVEVKAARSVRRTSGAWYYGQSTIPDYRGPFKQAAEGMHSLRKHLTEQDASLSGVVFWSAVLFPYIEFDLQSPEWHPWQSLDSRLFRSRSIGQIVLDVLNRARSHLVRTSGITWFKPDTGQPDLTQCKQLTTLLRRDFEFFERPSARTKHREIELKRYTEEQFEALDAMDLNPRVFFTGPAGTGKTLLALEAARRASANNRRILLVCYNNLLGAWLKGQLEALGPSVTVSTLHSYMLTVSNTQIPTGNSQSFWDHELPARTTESLLLRDDDLELFDELIIDEAQDVVHDDYLDVLDLCLKGGLSAGRWRCFGDFEKQSIFGSAYAAIETANRRLANAPRYSLRINCRNTPRIAELTHLLAGLTPPYTRIRRPDNGIEPDIRNYSSASDQNKVLIKELARLKSEGFADNDIVILSPHSNTASAAALLEGEWQQRVRPFKGSASPHHNSIGYCSIYTFKGLEAPAIIVTDVEAIGTDESLALFYVAITRALERLIILVHDNARQQLLSALTKGILVQGDANA